MRWTEASSRRRTLTQGAFRFGFPRRTWQAGGVQSLSRHQVEIQRNQRAWEGKPLLRAIYAGFYRRILRLVDPAVPGRVVELGSGMGHLRQHLPTALATDLFPNPWLDLACDAYELPFASGTVSHLILFDVFHHLAAPGAFFREAKRVLAPGGAVVLFEPYVSLASLPVYGWLHPEPLGWNRPISDQADAPGRPREHYAAQGNATRSFFRDSLPVWLAGWECCHREAFPAFAYLLSGGFSRPAFYPAGALGAFERVDTLLTRWPRLFAGRCLVALRRR